MELSSSVRSAKAADQQQSFSDPARLAFSEFGLPHSIIEPKETTGRLADGFWPSGCADRDFCGPRWFRGTIYKAANWIYVGNTKGFRRTRQGYSATAQSPKMVFVKTLISNAQALLSRPILEPAYRTGGPKIMLSAQQMQSLPDFFKEIPDPRRAQGRRHRLSTVLAIAAGATLCGMCGYLAISDWAKSLRQKARERFGCRYQNKHYIVPSLSIIRDVLIRVDPVHLDSALQRWNHAYGQQDESLAIDGKTMCNAIDDQGYQTHIMSAIGHQSKTCYTQKK